MAKQIKDTFLYFAYGSNLLKKRIKINNPTAEFIGIGRLHVRFLISYLSIKYVLANLALILTCFNRAINWIS